MKNPTHGFKARATTTNPPPPNVDEARATRPGMPSEPAGPASTRGRVILSEAKPAGRNSSSSTFTAPRREGGGSAAELGYTKPGRG